MKTMRSKALLSILFLSLAAVAQTADAGLSWKTDPNAAFDLARTSGKKVLLYAVRTGSMDCLMVSNESLHETAITALISGKCVPLRADLETDSWTAEFVAKTGRYSISTPLIAICEADGTIDAFHAGYIPSVDLLAFLTQNLTAGNAAGNLSTQDPATFEKAMAAYDDRNWSAACRLFNRLDDAALDPDHVLKKHFSLGVLYYINKDYDRAIEEYGAAESVRREPNTVYNIACAYSMKKDAAGAIFYLQSAVDAGFRDAAALKIDADLSWLRGTKEMTALIARLEGRPARPPAAAKKTVSQARTTVPAQQAGSYSGGEKKCFDLVNAMRAEKNLPPLVWADDLMAVARKHSADMGARNFFDHTNPDGLDPFQRMENGGVSFSMAAENIAYSQGYSDPASVAADGWRHSPGHYRNIMTEGYEESAIGEAITADGKAYYTQVFIKRK